MTNSKGFTSLEKSHKGAFPFRLATTSFIYPADYLPNVERIGPFFDEIELLFMETIKGDAAPLKNTIRKLQQKKEELDLTYNIHLPIDIHLGHEDHGKRKASVEAVKKVLDLTRPLLPTTHTLHLVCNPSIKKADLNFWQERTMADINELIAHGVAASKITIENLDYPFEWAAPIVFECDLKICMDIGHLLVDGKDLISFFNTYGPRIDLIHLHGVKDGKDHLPLDLMNEDNMTSVMQLLRRYQRTVSVEVFSFPYLRASLKFLEKAWQKL